MSACRMTFWLRPVLGRFAEMMQSKLEANDHKGGWQSASTDFLVGRLYDEAKELAVAITRGASPEEIRAEAADVANFAMMIADVCGALGERKEPTPPKPFARCPAVALGMWAPPHCVLEAGHEGDHYGFEMGAPTFWPDSACVEPVAASKEESR